MNNNTPRYGVNYVPSRNWWYCWLDWDRRSIKEDLAAIKSLGMDHIRVFCLWPVFQPNAAYVSLQALDRLEELLDIADEHGLDVEITVLNGFLSGFAFYPGFAHAASLYKHKNIYTDRDMIEAEKYLLLKLAERVGRHRRFLGFDIGNEINVLQYYRNELTIADGDVWLNEIMDWCDKIAPGRLHVNGVDHCPWFSNAAFSREALANEGAATSIHTWIEFTGARSRFDALDTGCVHLTEYCIELAKAYSLDPARKVWVEEFGASPEWMPADQIPEFAEQTIMNALSCENVWGLTWWCSHDLDRSLKGFHSLEYELGLLDNKNNIKPVGEKIAGLIKKLKADPVEPVKRSVALVLPDDIFDPGDVEYKYPDYPGWKFAMPYMDLLRDGVRPAIVLESRAGDKEYLKSRGIQEMHKLYEEHRKATTSEVRKLEPENEMFELSKALEMPADIEKIKDIDLLRGD